MPATKLKGSPARSAPGKAAMAELVHKAQLEAEALLAATDRVLVVYAEGAASLYYEGGGDRLLRRAFR